MKIITNENYVDKAEQVIDSLLKDRQDKFLLTTSKIRSLLSMTADIYNKAMLLNSNVLTDSVKERLSYLRVRCLYESGREPAVKDFVKKSGLLERLSEIESRSDYILFSHYMEALVAWHRYNGGKDA